MVGENSRGQDSSVVANTSHSDGTFWSQQRELQGEPSHSPPSQNLEVSLPFPKEKLTAEGLQPAAPHYPTLATFLSLLSTGHYHLIATNGRKFPTRKKKTKRRRKEDEKKKNNPNLQRVLWAKGCSKMIQSGSSCPVKLLTTLTSVKPFHKLIQLLNQGDLLFVNLLMSQSREVNRFLLCKQVQLAHLKVQWRSLVSKMKHHRFSFY